LDVFPSEPLTHDKGCQAMFDKLPTDNLYKFLTVLSMAMALACIGSVVSVFNNHNLRAETTAKEFVQIYGKNTVLPIEKEYADFLNTRLKQSGKDTDILLFGLLVFFVLSLIVTGKSARLWYLKEQRIRDALLEKELNKL
jgi:hypothetical protein